MSYNLDELLSSLEAQTGIEKSASATAQPVEASLSEIVDKKGNSDLVKQAQASGEALARELLTKYANEIQIKNETLQAEDAAKVTPTSDGTVADNTDATLTKAIAAGATTEDRADQLVDGGAPQGDGAAAQTQTATKEEDMNKLAQSIFEKIAAETEVATNPIVNKLQEDAALMDAQAAAKVQPTPEGTVNEILQQIVAGAQATGAGSEDMVQGAAAEGSVSAQPAGEEGPSPEADEQEKAAAVNALVGAGFDFDSAVSMVKEAELSMAAETFEMDKIAAMDELLQAGIDFDSAAEMVKQAASETLHYGTGVIGAKNKAVHQAKQALGAGKEYAGALGTAAKEDAQLAGMFAKDAVTGANGGRMTGLKSLLQTKTGKIGAGIAGAAAIGAGVLGAKKLTEKKAEAMGELLAAGVDFDSAAELVKQASVELYGE